MKDIRRHLPGTTVFLGRLDRKECDDYARRTA